MPIFNDEKRLQMARSILPSTRRKASRENLNNIRRAHRRRVRLQCHRLSRNPELWEEGLQIEDHPDGTIQWEKCERRTADKLHHFERWAVKVTKEIPQESRLSFMRAQLLEGPIGEHALLHLRFLDEFRHPSEIAIREARWPRVNCVRDA